MIVNAISGEVRVVLVSMNVAARARSAADVVNTISGEFVGGGACGMGRG